MKRFVLVSLFVNIVSGQYWSDSLVLDTENKYHVKWFVENDIITFQVEVATKGWVGFGISPNGGMKGSDVAIGWIKGGESFFHDRYAEGLFMPIIDRQQDWFLLWAHENDTHTTLRFKRSLNTCDDRDLPIMKQTTRYIYAYHPEDPDSPDKVKYHGPTRRGSRSVLPLKTKAKRNHRSDDDLQHFDITSRNVPVPHDRDTAYYCTFVKAPKLVRVHHIIMLKPIIQPGNEKFVHHFIIYKCNNASEDQMKPYLEKDFDECYTENNIPKLIFCFNPIAGWATGGGTFDFPDHAGMEIGEADIKYFMIEVHYDNPGLVPGIVDSSGMRLYYTKNLRRYIASAIAIGSVWFPCMFIPPKQEEFIITGHAHPGCLRQLIPDEGIKVFATLLHSHLIGKRMILRHFRGKEELPPILKDDNYDFNYQEFRLLPEERIVLPNDHLITECTYDSSKREGATFGGIATWEEMCISILLYYPKIALAVSMSCPSPHNIVKAIGVTEISDYDQYVISPITGRNETYMDFLNTYPWDPSSVNAVQKALMYSPHVNFCASITAEVKAVLILSKYPKVKKKYKENDICALR